MARGRQAFAVITALLLAVGCSRDIGPWTGAEGGKCYRNGTCDAGLVCSGSDLCVQLAGDTGSLGGDSSGGDTNAGDTRRGDFGPGCSAPMLWETVDVFGSPDGTSLAADGISVATDGRAYYAASGQSTASNGPWVVRRSQPGGVGWTTIDTFAFAGNNFMATEGIAVTDSSRIAAVGAGRVSGGAATQWLVRLSEDGNTFNTVDTYALAVGRDATALFVDFAPNGDLFVSGQAADVAGAQFSVIRRLRFGQSVWETVDEFGCDAQARSHVVRAFADYALAAVECEYAGVDTWHIRRSTDGGDTWNEVDRYTCDPAATDCGAEDIVRFGSTVYAGGNAVVGGLDTWVVRVSRDDGLTWLPSEDWNLTSGQNAEANGMAVDSAGVVFAGGVGGDGTSHWITRRSTDGGSQWETVDDFQLEPGQNATVRELAPGPDGSIYAAGQARDFAGEVFAVVRRGTCP